jgi:hypothetical protein
MECRGITYRALDVYFCTTLFSYEQKRSLLESKLKTTEPTPPIPYTFIPYTYCLKVKKKSPVSELFSHGV